VPLSRDKQEHKLEKQVSLEKFGTGIAWNAITEKADTHYGMILKCIGFGGFIAMVVKSSSI
jgi:hypothetical protein